MQSVRTKRKIGNLRRVDYSDTKQPTCVSKPARELGRRHLKVDNYGASAQLHELVVALLQ